MKDTLVKEYPKLGDRYRVRILKTEKKDPVLDIREYIEKEGSEGFFTRKGIRLGWDEVEFFSKMDWDNMLIMMEEA